MIKKEIGSEFWDIPTNTPNSLFPNNIEWFISGRSALMSILQENNFKTAALPFWCCESIIIPFKEKGIDVLFYNTKVPNTDVVLIIDYFGYTNQIGLDCSEFHGVVIRDLTHSVFSKNYYDADYYFGSLRKWAGFKTGGFAWGFKSKVQFEEDKTMYTELRTQAMKMKADYIEGKTDSKQYLKLFSQAEGLLDDLKTLPANIQDISDVKNLDIEAIKNIRRKNAEVLRTAFPDKLLFKEMNTQDCPLFVPIRVKDRDNLRRYLIEHDIYCPVHWPVSEYHRLLKEEKELYEEEMSLVCDQRYCEDDMQRIVDTINEFYKGRK